MACTCLSNLTFVSFIFILDISDTVVILCGTSSVFHWSLVDCCSFQTLKAQTFLRCFSHSGFPFPHVFCMGLIKWQIFKDSGADPALICSLNAFALNDSYTVFILGNSVIQLVEKMYKSIKSCLLSVQKCFFNLIHLNGSEPLLILKLNEDVFL